MPPAVSPGVGTFTQARVAPRSTRLTVHLKAAKLEFHIKFSFGFPPVVLIQLDSALSAFCG